jgi:hypothetical protein
MPERVTQNVSKTRQGLGVKGEALEESKSPVINF